MYVLIAILLLLVFIYYGRKPEKMTDAQTVNSIVDMVQAKRPELVPVQTMYIDPNGSSRMMFLNTDTYAGELVDISKETGIVRNIQGIDNKPNLFDYIKV